MALIAAHLNAELILVVTVYSSDRYIISLSIPLLPLPFFPSLISLMVSVDIKHHVYLLACIVAPSGNATTRELTFDVHCDTRADGEIGVVAPEVQ